jgi:2-iminobutanoate/2-iminopropanoate deaminase
MSKRAIQTEQAPQAIGPYSQAIRAGSLIFCSGQIALDPQSGALLDGDVRAQTKRVMDNLGAVLFAAGASWDDVVKTTIYLADLSDFEAVNGAYAEYFAAQPPARATVQVAALPKGAAVEIDAIAHVGEGS